MWIRHRFVVIIVCAIILVWMSFFSLMPSSLIQTNSRNLRADVVKMLYKRSLSDAYTTKVASTPGQPMEVIDKIKSIAKFIHNAKKHVRGSKTSDFLKQAIETMNTLLADMKIDPRSLYNRTVYEPVSVCPEKYMGSTFGYPFFYKGFETTTCKKSDPVWELVTIVKHVSSHSRDLNSTLKPVEKFVSSVLKINNKFNVIISVNNSKNLANFKTLYPSLTVVDPKELSDGMALNMLINEVKTPYVLVARDMQFFTNDTRLERLIRELESMKVKVASGAIRNEDGHWKKGCFQSAYRNFTLTYLEGYDESLHECLFCDFVQGPFMATKEYLTQKQFENFHATEGLFEEWFLRITEDGDEVIVCPDSMFHVNKSLVTPKPVGTWTGFMQKWDLFKVYTPSGFTINRPCGNKNKNVHGSKALSPCSQQSNADAVKTIMGVCERENIFCELQEGTALGAVKLGKTLPWERDADLTFLTANYSALKTLKHAFVEKGLSFTDLGSTWCCADGRTAGGKLQIGFKGWTVELYGQHMMDSELMAAEGMKPTRVLLDGQWVTVPRNPGLFVRNRYGREIYQHAEHWMTTGGESGWINYKTNVFKPCSNKGSHDCLDRYNADGDLPFIEIIP